jgi:hypothetical protein
VARVFSISICKLVQQLVHVCRGSRICLHATQYIYVILDVCSSKILEFSLRRFLLFCFIFVAQ